MLFFALADSSLALKRGIQWAFLHWRPATARLLVRVQLGEPEFLPIINSIFYCETSLHILRKITDNGQQAGQAAF